MRQWHSCRALSTTTLKFLSSSQLNRLLQLCCNSKALYHGQQVHQQSIVHGLDREPFTTTKLVQMYADCEDLELARVLFDRLSQPNVFAYTAILGFYSRHGLSGECISFYNDMKLMGVSPDKYVFPKVIRACAQSGCFRVGMAIHKDAIAYGAGLNLQVCNSLIDMYSKCGDIKSARRVFEGMVERDLLSWNSMVSGYVSNGYMGSALDLWSSMGLEGIESDLITWNTVMDAYCRMSQCDEARKIFEQIKVPNIISWTTLISGYSRMGNHEMTLSLFRDMLLGGKILPDLDCISRVIGSCGHLGASLCGREVHAYGIKFECGFGLYKSAGPALLTMYARYKRTYDLINVFNLMDKSDLVTWNAMIFCYAYLGIESSAIDCFRKVQGMGLQSDQTTVTAVLPVCDLDHGKQIHAYVRKNCLSFLTPVLNALIHMYSRIGHIQAAYTIYSRIVNRDIVTWNTMIGGFGMNGLGHAALQLLYEMYRSGVCPDSVTFTSVLTACSHSGLVDEGLQIFYRMKKDSGLNLRMEHFACVVDLLSRAGRIEDAVSLIKTMPTNPDKRVWGALLAASQAHQNVDVAILASEHLVHLEPKYAGHYVTLANTYGKAGRWNDAVRVRNLMEGRGLVKPSGYSWIGS